MRIVRFAAENFARLVAVEIVPGDDSVVTLRGLNGAGKSSVLNGIAAAIEGSGQLECPLRAGQQEGFVELDLADKVLAEKLTVTRKFWRTTDAEGTEKVKEKLTVLWKEGGAGPRLTPQATLDALAGGASFDPSEFLALKPEEQGERLRKLVSLDFSALDRKRDALYADRTRVNAEGKAKKARLDAMPPPSGIARVEVADLLARQKDLLEIERGVGKLKADRAEAARSVSVAVTNSAKAELAVHDLEEALSKARTHLMESRALEANRKANLEDADREVIMAPDVAPQLAEVAAQIQGAEATNARVASDAAHITLEAEVDDLRKRSTALSEDLDAVDTDKEKQLAEAKFPVDGLGFGPTGVTLRTETGDVIPFSQGSGAQRVRVAMAIGITSTAKLKVVRIHEGHNFDKNSLKLIAEMAAAAGAQVWLCTVAEGASGFEIVEGELASVDGRVVEKTAPVEPKRSRKEKGG